MTPISSDKIIEQIVYLDRKDDVGKIGTLRCDRRLTAVLGGEDSEIKKEHTAEFYQSADQAKELGWIFVWQWRIKTI